MVPKKEISVDLGDFNAFQTSQAADGSRSNHKALEMCQLQVETSPFDGAFITGEGSQRSTSWMT